MPQKQQVKCFQRTMLYFLSKERRLQNKMMSLTALLYPSCAEAEKTFWHFLFHQATSKFFGGASCSPTKKIDRGKNFWMTWRRASCGRGGGGWRFCGCGTICSNKQKKNKKTTALSTCEPERGKLTRFQTKCCGWLLCQLCRSQKKPFGTSLSPSHFEIYFRASCSPNQKDRPREKLENFPDRGNMTEIYDTLQAVFFLMGKEKDIKNDTINNVTKLFCCLTYLTLLVSCLPNKKKTPKLFFFQLVLPLSLQNKQKKLSPSSKNGKKRF